MRRLHDLKGTVNKRLICLMGAFANEPESGRHPGEQTGDGMTLKSVTA